MPVAIPVAVAAAAAVLKAKQVSDANKSKKSATEGIHRAGTDVYERGAMTPEEQSQYTGSFDIGKILSQLLQYQAGMGNAPSGYMGPETQYQQQGPLAQSLYGQTLKDVQSPYGAYESALQPQLQAAQDFINRGYAQRGLLRSGLGIEAMGRAGVELAIADAQNRMAARQQSLSQAGNLSQYMGGQQQQGLANFANLYGQQQSLGQAAMGRQAGQAQAAGQYQAYPYQAQLGQAYGSGAGQNAIVSGGQTGLDTFLKMYAGGVYGGAANNYQNPAYQQPKPIAQSPNYQLRTI